MRKIGIITATRAEFGLLSPVIRELRSYETSDFRVDLIITGTHLSKAYGYTIDEVRDNGFRIDHEIEISVNSDSALDISNNQSDALIKFTELFLDEQYSGIIILGDRYEILSVAIAAGNTHTPIFHLCGGDTTEGALDEWIRHSITKISYLHFVTNEVSRRRVIQMGEDPSRVFNYGSTSIDNILRVADMNKKEALESIGMEECDYALCTYHPVTMNSGSVDEMVDAFLDAIRNTPELQFVVTKSNSDQGGARINDLLDQAEKEILNLHVFTSLGVRRYLSLMKHAKFVLGNSSSGIIETPAFGIPTVNIGDRQRGRLQAQSIINCESDSKSIMKAMYMAMSDEYRDICKCTVGLYGDGHAAEQTSKKIFEVVTNLQIDLKKKFYDLDGVSL